MTSVLRIRRRHRLPEGNLGSTKPSYDEKAGAGNFPLLGDFRNGLSTKRCTGGRDPDCAIHGFCWRAGALDLSHHGVFRSGRVECGAAGRVASLKHGHLHYCARRAVQTSHGWQFSELRKISGGISRSTQRRARRRIYRHGRFSRTRRPGHPPNGKLHCHCPGSGGNAYRARPTRDYPQ